MKEGELNNLTWEDVDAFAVKTFGEHYEKLVKLARTAMHVKKELDPDRSEGLPLIMAAISLEDSMPEGFYLSEILRTGGDLPWRLFQVWLLKMHGQGIDRPYEWDELFVKE